MAIFIVHFHSSENCNCNCFRWNFLSKYVVHDNGKGYQKALHNNGLKSAVPLYGHRLKIIHLNIKESGKKVMHTVCIVPKSDKKL